MKHVYEVPGWVDYIKCEDFLSDTGPLVTIATLEQLRLKPVLFGHRLDPDCLAADEEFIILHDVEDDSEGGKSPVIDAIVHTMTREVCIKILAKVNGVAPEDITLHELADCPSE
jgi:hypothetical protein